MSAPAPHVQRRIAQYLRLEGAFLGIEMPVRNLTLEMFVEWLRGPLTGDEELDAATQPARLELVARVLDRYEVSTAVRDAAIAEFNQFAQVIEPRVEQLRRGLVKKGLLPP